MTSQNRTTNSNLRPALALALIAFLHGLVYYALLPHWMGEDEPWQVQNATLVADGHAMAGNEEFSVIGEVDARILAPLSHLQVRRRFKGTDLDNVRVNEDAILASLAEKDYWRRIDWLGRDNTIESFDEIERAITAANHPPLYYYVCAPLLWVFPDAEPRFQLLLLRFFSLFIFTGTVLLTYSAAKRIFPEGPGAMLAALIIALWPMSARSAAVVNNDVLTRFWVALSFFIAVYWITRAELTHTGWWRKVWPPLCLIAVAGLAMFTKTSGASAVAIVAMATLLHPASLRRIGSTVLTLVGLGAVVAVGAAAWLTSHNPGFVPSIEGNLYRLKKGLSAKNFHTLRDTITGKLNWESRSLDPDPAPALGFLLLALFGLSLIALAKRTTWVRSRLLWLAWGTALIQLLMMAMRGVSRGRYLMPVAPALAVLLVAGLFVLVPKRMHRHVALLFVAMLILFDGFFVWHGLGRAAWLEWRW